jgi:hypothetical protein
MVEAPPRVQKGGGGVATHPLAKLKWFDDLEEVTVHADLAQLVGFNLLGSVWLWAGAAKLKDIPGFVLGSGELLPPKFRPAAGVLGRLLPILEIVLGVLLVVADLLIVETLTVSCVLLAFFSVVLVRARSRGITTSCACFGTRSAAPIDRLTVLRTTGLLALSLVLLAVSAPPYDQQRWHLPVQQRAFGALLALLLFAVALVSSTAVRLGTNAERGGRR